MSAKNMSDPMVLKERDPAENWTVDDISRKSSDILKSKQAPFCAEMTVGLVDSESVSNHGGLRKRKNSHSAMDRLGNGVQNPVEQDKVFRANHTKRQGEEDKEVACQHSGTNTNVVPLSETILSPKKRKLILHIDLNNTILVSDAVTGQDPRAALNCYLTTVTWGKVGPSGKWQWLSESPSLLPPCPDAVSFYSQYGRNTKFTDTAKGQRFRDLHRRHLKLLEWQGPAHPLLSIEGEQGKHYHLVLPSFFCLLESLHREGRHFAIIFRTFGTDLPRVLRAVNCALEGQHPLFPSLQEISLPIDLSPGMIRCSKRKMVLTHRTERISTEDGGRKMYAYFSSREGLCGFQDHFDWWAKNQFSSQGGKPLLIDPHDANVHHIFIDDNIRLNDSDTIVHQQELNKGFYMLGCCEFSGLYGHVPEAFSSDISPTSLADILRGCEVFSGQENCNLQNVPTSELYDVCLVQTDLLEAIADKSYFCRCIRRCEENYENYVARTGDCI